MRLLLIYTIFVVILMTFGLQLVLWTGSLVQKRWRSPKRCFSLGLILVGFVSWMMAEEGCERGPLLFSLVTIFAFANSYLGPVAEKPSLFRAFFLALELLAVSLPFTLISTDLNPTVSMLSFFGASLVVCSSVLLIVAKWQKRCFKSNPLNRQNICLEGLWRRSRNIDLIFEWTVYVGFAFFLFQSPYGYVALIPLLLKTALILMVSKKKLVIKGALNY